MNIVDWCEYCKSEKLHYQCPEFEVFKCDCKNCDPFICSDFLDGFGITCRKTPHDIRIVGYIFGDPYADCTDDDDDDDDECGFLLYDYQVKQIRKYLSKRNIPIQLTLF